MKRTISICLLAAAAAWMFGYRQGLRAAAPPRVYELRTYTTHEGKLPALEARFRNHTTKLFEKHGMTNIGYWRPMEGPTAANTLIYLLAHPSKETALENWKKFAADPEWVKVRTESEKDGKINQKVDRIFLEAEDFSALK